MRWATSAGVIFDTGMAETMSVSMNPACTPTTDRGEGLQRLAIRVDGLR
jgi:hypothetical protein